MNESEMKELIADLRDQLATAKRKLEKVENSCKARIRQELLDECKLIPTKAAKSGLYEEDIRRILK